MKYRLIMLILALVLLVNATGCSEISTSQYFDSTPRVEQGEGEIYLGNRNERAVKLLSLTAKGEENVMISPLSIEMALSMLSNTMNKESKTKIETYLGMETSYLNQNSKEYIDVQNNDVLSIANSIWVKEEYKDIILESFKSTLKSNYDAEVKEVVNSPKPINEWVSNKTNGMIPSIIDEIPNDFVSMMVNAIYFKGTWVTKFDEQLNEQSEFNLNDGEKSKCTYMTDVVDTYVENSQATGFIKQYKDGYSFMGIMPKTDNLDISTLNLDTLLETKTYEYDVVIKVPKFESNYGTSLVGILGELGLADIFKDGAVSEIINNKELKITDIVHKTAIKLDETGTEASAATSAMIETCSLKLPKETKQVYLDKPFIYAIMDKNNTVVFIGKINNPTLG